MSVAGVRRNWDRVEFRVLEDRLLVVATQALVPR